jgi:hypothetical protein
MYADEKGNETEAPGTNDYIDIGVLPTKKWKTTAKNSPNRFISKNTGWQTATTVLRLTVKGKPVRGHRSV